MLVLQTNDNCFKCIYKRHIFFQYNPADTRLVIRTPSPDCGFPRLLQKGTSSSAAGFYDDSNRSESDWLMTVSWQMENFQEGDSVVRVTCKMTTFLLSGWTHVTPAQWTLDLTGSLLILTYLSIKYEPWPLTPDSKPLKGFLCTASVH